MDRGKGDANAFLNLFDIVGTTASGIAAPVIGDDDQATFVSVVQDDEVPPPLEKP